jgi:hypothetical protein
VTKKEIETGTIILTSTEKMKKPGDIISTNTMKITGLLLLTY